MSALGRVPAMTFPRRWRARLGEAPSKVWARLQACVAGHCRGVAMGLVLATLAGIGLSLYLWAGQRFAPPPVSFMSGGWPLAAQLPMALAFSVVGAVLASRQARNPIGWLFLAIGVTSSFVPAVHNMVAAAGNSFVSPGPLTVALAWLVSSFHLPLVGALLIVVFLVFPDGRVLSGRWWNGAVLAVGGALLVGIGLAIDPRGLLWYPLLPNPFAGPAWIGPASDILQLGGLASVLVGLAIASVAMVLRYRAYTPAERRPLKWIAVAIVLLVVSGSALMVVRYGLPVSPAVGEVVLTATILVAMLLPIAAGIGILRHRLFDIELILNHALVYVPLSALMTGIYTASVALFQRLFVAVTGETSDVAIILTTLILATTFTPMRKALEGFVDRHFKPLSKAPAGA
ncbi:MAG: hypothetical protein FIA92_11055, partial [Chloroflexi bacterium]|nr:hypothetical protein [Chloroflexota bacterium]